MNLRFTLFSAIALALASSCNTKSGSVAQADGGSQTDTLSAYLMVFHQDATHGLHMAVSEDEIGRAHV